MQAILDKIASSFDLQNGNALLLAQIGKNIETLDQFEASRYGQGPQNEMMNAIFLMIIVGFSTLGIIILISRLIKRRQRQKNSRV